MATQPEPFVRFRNLDEYYAYIDSTEERILYAHGAGGKPEAATANHARIIANLGRLVGNQLYDRPENTCEVLDSSVLVMTPLYEQPYYPDLTIVYGERRYWKDRRDTLASPLLIFEVLSRKTANTDKGEKLDAYFSIPGFREYVIVDQYRYTVSRHVCARAREIVRHELDLSTDTLALQSIPVSLALINIYAGVLFE